MPWPVYMWQGSVSEEHDCQFLQVCLLFHFLSVLHEQALTGGILKTELSAWQGRSAGHGSSGLDQLSWGLVWLTGSQWRWQYLIFPYIYNVVHSLTDLALWFKINFKVEEHMSCDKVNFKEQICFPPVSQYSCIYFIYTCICLLHCGNSDNDIFCFSKLPYFCSLLHGPLGVKNGSIIMLWIWNM